jgi:hypothetical protein
MQRATQPPLFLLAMLQHQLRTPMGEGNVWLLSEKKSKFFMATNSDDQPPPPPPHRDHEKLRSARTGFSFKHYLTAFFHQNEDFCCLVGIGTRWSCSRSRLRLPKQRHMLWFVFLPYSVEFFLPSLHSSSCRYFPSKYFIQFLPQFISTPETAISPPGPRL